ncbi:hypothetical protein [Pseudoteredinibacter isoporae]|uniref:hypothetical protein n=1 Tax=Pseudoteredinibacter isoporae TaxID=570281 RepID=UPI0031063757
MKVAEMGIYKEENIVSFLSAAGFLSALLYLGLGYGNENLWGSNPVAFLVVMSSLASISFWVFWFLSKVDTGNIPREVSPKNYIWIIVGWAIVFRFIGLFFDPIFEDDFYRYLWDGFLFSKEGTPYGKAPSEYFGDNSIAQQMQPILDGINYPDVATIYGPVFQYSFLLAHKFLPADVLALQSIYSVVDVLLILVLSRLCKPQLLVLYAWCPLAIKEIAFTAHPDGLAVFLLMAAYLALVRKHALIAVILIALSVCAKIFALLFVPFVLLRVHLKYWLVFALILALVYAPFLISNSADIAVLFTFAGGWQFNGSIHPLLQSFFHWLSPEYVATLTSLLCGLSFLSFYMILGWTFFRDKTALIPRGDWVLGVFFLLAPVVNAWYLIWLLAFATIYPSRWAWVLSVSILFSYITGYTTGSPELDLYQQPLWARVLEYGVVFFAVYFDVKAARGRRREETMTQEGRALS